MASSEILVQIFQPLFITKVFFLIILFAFAIFTLVVARQVQVMNSVITENQSSSILGLLAIFIVIAAISLFIVSLAML